MLFMNWIDSRILGSRSGPCGCLQLRGGDPGAWGIGMMHGHLLHWGELLGALGGALLEKDGEAPGESSALSGPAPQERWNKISITASGSKDL